jgi:hypothetical protein
MPQMITIIPICIALLITGLALPLAIGRVPPNAFYGYRTRTARSDPAIWYATNRTAAHWLMIVSAWVIAAVATMNLLGAPPMTTLLVGANLMAIGAVLGGLLAWRLERRMVANPTSGRHHPTTNAR